MTASCQCGPDRHGAITCRSAFAIRARGCPPGCETQVFEPFFSTKATGLGMGLGIARSIVESHGGAIELYNDPTGVVVTINLPVAEVVA